MTDSHPENESPNATVVASATGKEKMAWQTPQLYVMGQEAVLEAPGSGPDLAMPMAP